MPGDIVRAGFRTAEHIIDQKVQFLHNGGIVAEIGRHLEGNKGIYQERRHLELEKASQPMHKQLLGVFSDFRIFFEQLLPQGHIALQPGIDLIDLPIQDEGINNAEEQFYPYP